MSGHTGFLYPSSACLTSRRSWRFKAKGPCKISSKRPFLGASLLISKITPWMFLCNLFRFPEQSKHSTINNCVFYQDLLIIVSTLAPFSVTFCVFAFRSVLGERGPTCRRFVNVAQSPLSCMTGSTWASWPCYHWCCTGFSSSGTLERKGECCAHILAALSRCDVCDERPVRLVQFQRPAAACHSHAGVHCISSDHAAGQ